MEQGERWFRAYVEGFIKGTAFDIESVEPLNTPDSGFGTAALHVIASDSAICVFGLASTEELREIEKQIGLEERIASADSRLRVRIDVDSENRIVVREKRGAT